MKSYSIAMVAACPFPVNYGSPAAIRELSETLSEIGHEIHVVTYPDGENLSVGNAQLHRVSRLGKSSGTQVGPSKQKFVLDFLLLIKVCQVVWRHKVDIIHAHNYEGGLAGVLAKLVTRKPLVYNSVNLMSEELASYAFFKPAFIGRWVAAILDWFMPIFPDHIVTVTADLYDWYIKHGISPKRLTMVPCGVRPAMFDGADPSKFLAKYSVGSRPVVMYTGIHTAFQRVDYLLRAFSVVLKEEPSALLMVVSPITNEPNFPVNMELAKSLGISDNVIFIGPHELEELPDYLAMATVTVVPRPECHGHPIKLLNYMMAGKPIVCFAAAAKGVQHLHDALIVPNHDLQKMGEAILTLLRDPALAKRLGANARETVLNNFDWQILAKKIEAIYDGLLLER
jgi:glycosyltransferase involved in cell wall biosynthesis